MPSPVEDLSPKYPSIINPEGLLCAFYALFILNFFLITLALLMHIA